MKMSQQEVAQFCAEQLSLAIGRHLVRGEDQTHGRERVMAKLQAVSQDLMGRSYESALEWAKARDSRAAKAIAILGQWGFIRSFKKADGTEVVLRDWSAIHPAWQMVKDIFADIAYGQGRNQLVEAAEGARILREARKILRKAFPSKREPACS